MCNHDSFIDFVDSLHLVRSLGLFCVCVYKTISVIEATPFVPNCSTFLGNHAFCMQKIMY